MSMGEAWAIVFVLVVVYVGVSLCWLGMELLAIWAHGRWTDFLAGRLEAHRSWIGMVWFARLGCATLGIALALVSVLSYRADRSGYSLAQAILGLVCLAVIVLFALRIRRRSRKRDTVAPSSLMK